MYEIPGFQISLKSGADITKYLPVKMSSGKIVVATAAADIVVGFVQREGKANETVPVMINGVTMAVASAAISAGAAVTPTTGGKMVTASASTKFVGIALAAATAANDVIPVLLMQGTTEA